MHLLPACVKRPFILARTIVAAWLTRRALRRRRPGHGRLSVLWCSATLALCACSDGSDSPAVQGPFAVSLSEWTYVDSSRGTPASGDYPALATRTLPALVFTPDAPGRFPLLLFSHGLGASPAAYAPLAETVAAAGFVVVAPAFPLTSLDAPAGPDPVDTQQQPGDISFLIDVVSDALAAGVAPFAGRVDIARIGAFGHSNGGITTLGVIANSCCSDARIGAAVALSSTAAPYNGGVYDFSSSPPLLLVHGTQDALIPFEASLRVFNEVAAAKGMLTLHDLDHSGFLQPSGHGFESTAGSIIDFFRAHLSGDVAAQARLRAGQVYDTGAELLYSADGGTEVTLPLPPPITNRLAAVEPNSNLVHGQVVTVSWRNFIAGNTINILQCSSGGTGGNDVCDFGNAHILAPNPDGEGTLLLEIIVGAVGSGRCDATTDDCVVVVNDGGLQAEEAILRIPISFAP